MKNFHTTILRWSTQRWFGASSNALPDRSIIDGFKAMKPCAWDPMAQTWWFPETFYGAVVALIEPFHPVIPIGMQYKPDADPRMRPHWRHDDPYLALCVTEDAPQEIVKLSWQWLMRFHDPARSVGGSYEVADRIDRAYKTICSQRGVQP